MSEARAGRPIIFGEVLYDHFPDGSVVLGGAPFNVAWHLQAFGQAPLFVSRVGNDPLGRRIRDTMSAWGMDTSGLQSDSSHPTGTVEVSFQSGEPAYDILGGRAYDYVDAAALPPLGPAALLYHGTLALRSELARQAFAALSARTDAPRFLDVNLRDPWWQRQTVRELIRDAAWVKLNEQELRLLNAAPAEPGRPGTHLREEFGLRALIVTCGDKGAELLGADTRVSVAPQRADRMVDTVGAGDAFTSVMLLGLLEDWPPQTAMERAQSFASAIVGVRGATVDDPGFYAEFTAQWGEGGSP